MFAAFSGAVHSYAFSQADGDEKLKRSSSITVFNVDDKNVEKSLEYFFASDARYFLHLFYLILGLFSPAPLSPSLPPHMREM